MLVTLHTEFRSHERFVVHRLVVFSVEDLGLIGKPIEFLVGLHSVLTPVDTRAPRTASFPEQDLWWTQGGGSVSCERGTPVCRVIEYERLFFERMVCDEMP